MAIVQSLLGIIFFLGIAWFFSENRKALSWKKVSIGIALQIAFALIFLKVPLLQNVFLFLNKGVLVLKEATEKGAVFMFGFLSGGPTPYALENPSANFVLAFQILPIILVMSALTMVLYHWGVLQFAVKILAKILQKSLQISGVQGLGVGANVFLGIVEAPLIVRPYLAGMSRGSLFALMTAGMSTVAGTVMVLYATILDGVVPNALGHILTASLISAPAAVILSHLFIPSDETMEREDQAAARPETGSALEALVKGTMDGVQMLFAVAAMIIVLFAMVEIVNQVLGLLPNIEGKPISLTSLFAYFFRPLVWLIGIPWSETAVASELMSYKTVLNEFVGYQKLAGLPQGSLSEKSTLVLTYAMCGFANFGSLGIMVGSMGMMAPERRPEVIELGVRAILAGTLATLMTGSIVQIIS